MLYFISEIGKTRLQKVARIKTADKLRENQATKLQNHAQLHISFQNFKTRAEAEQWLLQ
ncbi:hypothetical protein [Adhaeribacter terreus]|uniref:Uncharacterized protein n=1 Tax=Adhaeribacter terreus TaxID=529703 RepID=A0ABW0E6D2_9BACT